MEREEWSRHHYARMFSPGLLLPGNFLYDHDHLLDASPPPQPALDRIAADADEAEVRATEWRERAGRAEEEARDYRMAAEAEAQLADVFRERALAAEHRERALEETVGELLDHLERAEVWWGPRIYYRMAYQNGYREGHKEGLRDPGTAGGPFGW